MNSQLQKTILGNLKSDYAMKVSGEWLRGGKCPSCSKKELYTHAITPVMVKCGRMNKCGFESSVRDLMPDLFVEFNKKYPARRENPNATANAYMELVRGLNPVKLKNNWTQGKYWNPNGDKGTATVMFTIVPGVTMERFVEEVTISKEDGEKDTRRAHFTGKHKGLWWQPSGMDIKESDQVWIVEGCIDALSLWAHGIKAVAILSCGNYPKEKLTEHEGKDIDWVWALDNDKAGKRAMRKHHKATIDDFAREKSRCALPPEARKKEDWNDLYTKGRLNDKFIKQCFYEGSLLTAKSPFEKALLMWREKHINGFDLIFNNRTYWFHFDHAKFLKGKAGLREEYPNDTEEQLDEKASRIAGSIKEIANCQTTFLYFQANLLTDESWYYARVDFPHGGAPVKSTFNGAQVSAAGEFKKRLISIAPGASFTGTTGNLDYIIQKDLYGIKTVQTIDYIGYSKDHAAYMFNNLAVSDGKIFELNEEDFFEIGKTNVKSLCNSPKISIGSHSNYSNEWHQHFWSAFGNKGLVSLAFWIGSLFAEQIRDRSKSYPFLEVVGEAGSGKSTLIEFMWKLCGRADYEGFDPTKSTLAARSRNFSQVSNLPVVLIEGDRGDDTAKAKGFDWDEMKTAYNGRASRSRGIKNQGNDTYEPPFRGSLVISQNAEVSASEAILQRIIHLKFDKSGHSPETKESAEFLEQTPMENISYWLLDIIQQEKEILEHFFKKTPEYAQTILNAEGIRSVRIAKNHGQIMALTDVAAKVLGLNNKDLGAAREFIISCAQERERAISADHAIVQDFWETYEYLTGKTEGLLNHALKPDDFIAVNLNHFVQVASSQSQYIPDLSELKRHLKTSRVNKFVGIKSVNSRHFKRTVNCWVFQKTQKGK